MNRRNPIVKNKKMWMGAGAVAAGALAFYGIAALGTQKLVSVALDRRTPKSSPVVRKWLTGTNKCDAVLKMVNQAAEHLREEDCETVSVTGRDGVTLVGHWRPCPQPKRILIAMHGWRSAWNREFGLIADFWYNNGCSVLFAEQRGHCNSGGDHISFGLLERYDCLTWIDWVQSSVGTDLPIYLAGISMGASTVLMAAGFDLPKQVHGVMADCGYTSLYAIWKHVVTHNMHLSYKIREKHADSLCRKRIHVGTKAYSTVEAMACTQTPVLFIHGSSDHFVPIEMTYENYLACVAPKFLVVVPGADHGLSYLVDRQVYEGAMMDFWAMFD